jgi:predicted permease
MMQRSAHTLNRHLSIVSTAFTWSGVLLGLPSLAAVLYFVWALVGLHLTPTAAAGGKTDANSLVGLLVGGAQLAGKALKWFTTSAQWAIALLGVVSMLLLVAAIALFAIGRGLQAHQTWARILGMLLAAVLLFAGASCALMLRQGLAAAASALAATSVYILWVLWREFA